MEDRRLLAVSFEFNYISGDPVGFNDPSESDTFKAALESAATRLGGWLFHDATVQLNVTSHPFDGSAVAKATSEPAPTPAGGGFVHGVIPSKILGQGDLNGAAADGRLEVYFFHASDSFFYATDPADVDADDEIDFQAVIIHELVHTLGFTSAANADGSDDSGQGITTPGTWSPFDRLVSDVDGNRLIDADPQSPTAFQMDTTAWATHSVGGKGPDAGLFFDGPIAKAVYGGRVPLYSPATFSLESSVSHLDSEGYPDETFLFSPLTHLMSHAIVDDVVPQELTLLEKAILADVGILLQEDVAPTITAPSNIVLEGNSQGGFSGLNQELLDYLNAAVASDLIDPDPTVSHNKPPFLPLGQNTITFTATDVSGNVSSASSVVSVIDTTAPEFTLPEEVTIDSNLATGADLANTQLLDLIDAASTDVADTLLAVSADIEVWPFGTTTVVFTVTDDSGNAATATTSLTVNDASLVVTTLNDELDADPQSNPADLSLREAISLANTTPGANIIRIEDALTGKVLLDAALGQLEITDSVSLFGLGRDATTIDAQGNSRAMEITGSDVDVTLDGLTVSGGRQVAESEGGAGVRFQTEGTLTVRDATVSGNSTSGTGAAGAGIQVVTGNLVLVDTIVSGNQTTGSSGSGGGVWAGGGDVSVIRSTFTGNTTTSEDASGAGLYILDGTATISQSTFSGNSTAGNRAGGGGLALLSADATIHSSTISGNSTTGLDSPGAGLRTLLTPLKLITSTISGNATGSSGGGIYADRGDLDVDNTTITGNQAAGQGGGIGVPSGSNLSLTIDNSIVAGNTDGGSAPEFAGAGVLADSTSVQFSLIGDNTGTTLSESQLSDPTTGNIVGDPNGAGTIDPMLAALADNGGPTQTHLLQYGSPAIDAGDPMFDAAAFTPPLTHDQRGSGFTRIFNGRIDIGATEVLGSPIVSWPNPPDIIFGTPLGAEQLNATASVDGSFSYIPPPGVFLSAGQNQTLTVVFTPASPIYDPISVTASINVNRADPVITWADPDDIVVGIALDETQLNATAHVTGSFTYQPPLGTVLSEGPGQELTVTFTPQDQNNFNIVTDTATINVIAAQDFGDAPSPYPVLLVDDGARHPESTLVLGSGYDVDIDGNPSAMADGDGVDDDGVLQIADLVAVVESDTGASFTVSASGAGKLDAWIDFNGDGDWDNNEEQVLASVDLVAGENILAYTIPSGATAGQTVARFRLSSGGGLAPTGPASDGEVEDYLLTIMDGDVVPDVSVHLVGGAVEVSMESGDLVTRSGQSELFRSPWARLGSLSVLGTSVDESVTLDLGNGFALPSRGLGLDGGLGGNTLIVIGEGREIDLTDPLYDITDFRRLDLSSADANTVTIDAAAVASLSPALKLLSIAAGPGDRIIVEQPQHWRMTDPITADGKFLVTANHMAGGNESIEAAVPHAWQNFVRAGDVNNDGSVTAADALRIINELGRREYSDRESQDLMEPLSVASWPGVYFDHNGDDRATALDALRVINDVARQRLAGGSGESGQSEEVVVSPNPAPAEIARTGRDDQEMAPNTRRRYLVDVGSQTQPGSASIVSTQETRGEDVASGERVDQLLSDQAFLADLLRD